MRTAILTTVLMISAIAFADNHGTAPAAKMDKAAKAVEATTADATKKVDAAAANAGTATADTKNAAKDAMKNAKAAKAAGDAAAKDTKKAVGM